MALAENRAFEDGSASRGRPRDSAKAAATGPAPWQASTTVRRWSRRATSSSGSPESTAPGAR